MAKRSTTPYFIGAGIVAAAIAGWVYWGRSGGFMGKSADEDELLTPEEIRELLIGAEPPTYITGLWDPYGVMGGENG